MIEATHLTCSKNWFAILQDQQVVVNIDVCFWGFGIEFLGSYSFLGGVN